MGLKQRKEEAIQANIFYAGHVQGVGFRYTSLRYAQELGLKGWVRNLSDGRVEILIAGPKKDIDHLCTKLEQHFGSYIKNQNIDYQDNPSVLQDFHIR